MLKLFHLSLSYTSVTRKKAKVKPLVVQDRQVELAKALGVGEHVDFDDLPARNREAEYDTRPSAWSPHGAHRSVHERRLCGPGTPLNGSQVSIFPVAISSR